MMRRRENIKRQRKIRIRKSKKIKRNEKRGKIIIKRKEGLKEKSLRKVILIEVVKIELRYLCTQPTFL